MRAWFYLPEVVQDITAGKARVGMVDFDCHDIGW